MPWSSSRKYSPLLVCLTFLFISGCSSNYYKYEPDTLVSEQIINTDLTSNTHQSIELSKTKVKNAKRAQLSAKVFDKTNTSQAKAKEIVFTRTAGKYSDSQYRDKVHGWSIENYLYTSVSADVGSLVTPLENKQTSSTKNRKMGGKHSLIWDKTTRLSTGGRIEFKQIKNRLACNLHKYATYACIVTKDGLTKERLSQKKMENILPAGPLTSASMTAKAATLISKYNLFNHVDAGKLILAKDQRVLVKDLPTGMRAKVTRGRGKSIIDLSFTDPSKAFNVSRSAFGISKQYAHLVEQYAKPKQAKISLISVAGSKQQTLINYYDSSPILAEIKRLESLGKGYIRLTANMNNVDVYINGNRAGKISNGKPFVSKLVEGSHTIQVKKDFFGAKTIRVKIAADDAFAYDFDLKPSGNLAEQMGKGKIIQSTGVLVVATIRNDLKIHINGVTRIPPTKLPNMPSGKHKMKVTSPNGTKVVEITVKDNAKTLIDLDELL